MNARIMMNRVSFLRFLRRWKHGGYAFRLRGCRYRGKPEWNRKSWFGRIQYQYLPNGDCITSIQNNHLPLLDH
jgi:hypothetical protein